MSASASTNTLLQISNGDSPETWETIADVGDIAGPSFSATEHDTSTHSLGTPWMTQIVGLLKNEKVTFPVNFDYTEATHEYASGSPAIGLGYMFRQRTLGRWRLVPIGYETHAVIFDAYVSQIGHAFPVDGVMRANVTLSPTGEPDFEQDASDVLP